MTTNDADTVVDPEAGTYWERSDHDGVVVLTFTRPPNNQMSIAAMTELEPILEALAEERGVKVIMLTGGIDGFFVAHADLDDVIKVAMGQPVAGDPAAWRRCQHLLETMPQPTVAAIDGQAWAGGCEITLACTMRVGSQRASLAQIEVTAGIIPIGGGTQRLPRIVGSGIAAELCLTGRTVDADEGQRIGLLNAVLPTEGFREAAIEWCQGISRHKTRAVFGVKKAIVGGLELPLEDGIDHETRVFGALSS